MKKKEEEEMEDGMALRDWEEGGQPRRGGSLSWQCQRGQAWKAWACGRHGPRATSSPLVAAGARIVGERKKEKKEKKQKNDKKKESLCKKEIKEFEEVQVEEDEKEENIAEPPEEEKRTRKKRCKRRKKNPLQKGGHCLAWCVG